MAHPKIAKFLDEGGSPEDPEFKRTLVVLGPQEHKGTLYEAHDLTGKPATSLPLDKEGNYATLAQVGDSLVPSLSLKTTTIPAPAPAKGSK